MIKPHFPHRDDSYTIRVGAFEFTKKGVSRFDLRDPYHLVMTLRWPQFFLALFLADIAINLVFATLYWLVPGCIANSDSSFSQLFFFSIETLATVGYGVMSPATTYGHLISSLEILCGLAFTALVTGVIFVRFSKPRAKFHFADVAVITVFNGKPTLMIRVGNGRPSLLSDAQARVTVAIAEETPEKHTIRRVTELKLEHPTLAIFALTWNLIHTIDAASPLHGLTAETLPTNDVRLFLALEARDPALGAVVHDMHDYTSSQILIGMRYQDVVSYDPAGRANADLTRISAVEQDGTEYLMPIQLS